MNNEKFKFSMSHGTNVSHIIHRQQPNKTNNNDGK